MFEGFAPARPSNEEQTEQTVMTEQTRLNRTPAEIRKLAEEDILIGRLGEPEDIAEAAAFLASEEAGFITGQVLSPNGGEFIVGI